MPQPPKKSARKLTSKQAADSARKYDKQERAAYDRYDRSTTRADSTRHLNDARAAGQKQRAFDKERITATSRELSPRQAADSAKRVRARADSLDRRAELMHSEAWKLERAHTDEFRDTKDAKKNKEFRDVRGASKSTARKRGK